MKVFGGVKSTYFAKEICKNLSIDLGLSERKDFSDGEFIPNFEETVRGKNVYLVQSTFQPLDNLFELLMMADAAKRSGAKSIIGVVPYKGFARQDKKDIPRTPITSSLIAKMIENSGINHLITMDLHNNSIEGFYNIPVSHLYSSAVVVPYIRERFFNKNLIIVSPDMGGTKKAKVYSQFLRTDMAICYKYRESANEVKEMKLIGDVRGKDCLIIDDIADTCGTLVKCASILKENGANSVIAAIAHPIFSGRAYERVATSDIEEIIVTNSIPLVGKEVLLQNRPDSIIGYNKVKVVDVAPLFASAIRSIENGTSISANFIV